MVLENGDACLHDKFYDYRVQQPLHAMQEWVVPWYLLLGIAK